ncbi:hydrolase Nlp/P60 [Lentzea sp. NBRC 105346]|uniref:C40 family peptidase n=1 Tax=Lentzea sp. NBRC 105346 TaxID=3032205 RepID=UPI0024A176EE|nr:NlpC/P60 family protein [Lentzea sp. NBRC 105346]GLZ33722.1 hydrolase Nlp/P60 [Lentzea sp. NBRC 105346]
MPGIRTPKSALVAAVIAAAAFTPSPVTAQPANDALNQYNELARQAEKLHEDHLKAQEDLKAKQGELDKANGDLNSAKQAEEAVRGRVDLLTEASFQGARFNQLSALLVAESQQDFLNRMTALNALAADNAEAIGTLQAAVDKATAASGKAKEATDAAQKLVDDIAAKKVELDKQVNEARAKYKTLSAPQKATLANPGNTGPVNVPAGAAGVALQFALAQRGDPYVFGANGPDAWDCSSLTQKSYAAAGISIPRVTYDQAKVGRAVGRGEVAPGDLIIYYSGQSHVAMAVDGTNAVHASTEGVPVKIAPIDSIGPISVIRRVVG